MEVNTETVRHRDWHGGITCAECRHDDNTEETPHKITSHVAYETHIQAEVQRGQAVLACPS